jgi:hypothetical protein
MACRPRVATICVSDPCIYIFRAGHVFAMIALYAWTIFPQPAMMPHGLPLTSFKAQLGARFKIKDLGDLSQLMGMHITRDRSAGTMSLDESKYLRDILAKYGITNPKPSSLPMDPGFLAGLAHMSLPPLTWVARDIYPSLLGSLMYAAVCTRTDVSTALLSILGSAQASPTDAHLQSLKKVLRYLHGTIDIRLTLGGGHEPHSPTWRGAYFSHCERGESTRAAPVYTFACLLAPNSHDGFASSSPVALMRRLIRPWTVFPATCQNGTLRSIFGAA